MSLFGKILEKLGMKKQEAPAASATMAKQAVKPASSAQVATPPKPAPYRPTTTSAPAPQTPRPAGQPVPAAPAPAPMEMVDVLSKLETMAKGTNLDWKVSIVDLLKVLGLESSLEARKELATELGCPADVMKDNVKMNVLLHKTVLAEIAKNGGNIPKELLD
jgi:hypothetical protein